MSTRATLSSVFPFDHSCPVERLEHDLLFRCPSRAVVPPIRVPTSVAKVGQINFSKVKFSNSWPVFILFSNSKVVFPMFYFS